MVTKHGGLSLGEWLLCAIVVGSMTLATIYDYEITAALRQIKWKSLTNFMGRTIFEGELPGANDPFILLLVAALTIYFGSQHANATLKSRALGIDAGFILLSALTIAFLMVQGPKWTMGRARPDLVFDQGLAYSRWFAFGPLFIADGAYRGAFPSGHTAQAFVAMSIAYVLAGNPYASSLRKWIGWTWGASALLFTMMMGAARCISSSHWLTDVIGSIAFGWLLMHLLYFRWLCVPDRHRYLNQYGKTPLGLGGWELKMAAYLLIFTLALVMIGNGLHALLLKRALELLSLIPIGMALAIYMGKKWLKLRAAGGSIRLSAP